MERHSAELGNGLNGWAREIKTDILQDFNHGLIKLRVIQLSDITEWKKKDLSEVGA